MEFWQSFIILLILIGLVVLAYIVGRVVDAIFAYVNHLKDKYKQRNSPVANYKKGKRYGRI